MENTINPMKKIKIEKITLNVGAGKDEEKLRKGIKLLKNIVGIEPMKTITSKRIPTWALRPGLAIGCKITLRGEKAVELLKKLLEARDNKLSRKQFDQHGNFSFGIAEYVDIPGVDYDPEIKIMGLEVAVTMERAGFHINRRRIKQKPIPKHHRINVGEAVQFMKKRFGIKLTEEAEA